MFPNSTVPEQTRASNKEQVEGIAKVITTLTTDPYDRCRRTRYDLASREVTTVTVCQLMLLETMNVPELKSSGTDLHFPQDTR